MTLRISNKKSLVEKLKKLVKLARKKDGDFRIEIAKYEATEDTRDSPGYIDRYKKLFLTSEGLKELSGFRDYASSADGFPWDWDETIVNIPVDEFSRTIDQYSLTEKVLEEINNF